MATLCKHCRVSEVTIPDEELCDGCFLGREFFEYAADEALDKRLVMNEGIRIDEGFRLLGEARE